MASLAAGTNLPGVPKSDDRIESIIVRAEQLLLVPQNEWDHREVSELLSSLISVYDTPFGDTGLKQRAAGVVVRLASLYPALLELVIQNAEQYASEQHIDDAFPFNPNAFEILARIQPRNERVISFLNRVIRYDYGVAKWAASEALSELDDPTASRSKESPQQRGKGRAA